MATSQQSVIERIGEMAILHPETNVPEKPEPADGTMPRCPHGVYDPHGDGAACTLCQTDYDGEIEHPLPHLAPGDLISGFQVEPEPHPRADAPEWVFDDVFLRRLLTEAKQGADRPINIARWAASIYLFYRCGWSEKHIGEYLGTSKDVVRKILARARARAAELLKSKGTPVAV
jgi:hypothetical protein